MLQALQNGQGTAAKAQLFFSYRYQGVAGEGHSHP